MNTHLGWIADIDRAEFGGRVTLLWPLTLYNRSGVVIMRAASRFNVAVSDVYVVHDDIDLKPGM
jgi:peptidyl-tRNA hydrolase